VSRKGVVHFGSGQKPVCRRKPFVYFAWATRKLDGVTCRRCLAWLEKNAARFKTLEFTVRPTQGAACMATSMVPKGCRFVSMDRRGTRVTVTYEIEPGEEEEDMDAFVDGALGAAAIHTGD